MTISRIRRRATLLAVTGLLVALAAPAAAIGDESSAIGRVGRQALDLAVLRPMGLVQTVAGFAAYVGLMPFAIITDNEQELWDICVTEPADQTFRRPLGEH